MGLDMDDFFTLDIPKIPDKYTVVDIHESFFIVQDKNGNGVRVKKTDKNKDWKVGDIVHLSET